VLVRLGIDDERDATFDCGDSDLNEFFFKDSRLACKELVSVTYAWIESGKTLAFFSVSNDAVKRELMSKSVFKRLCRRISRGKRYSTLPAVKIGRLGTSVEHQSNGVGSDILDFIKFWFTEGNKTGCRFIIVDAYNNERTINFYLKNGFSFLLESDESEKTRLMFFDLMTI
jgi:GNAT superfamily N-acetyltransferase